MKENLLQDILGYIQQIIENFKKEDLKDITQKISNYATVLNQALEIEYEEQINNLRSSLDNLLEDKASSEEEQKSIKEMLKTQEENLLSSRNKLREIYSF